MCLFLPNMDDTKPTAVKVLPCPIFRRSLAAIVDILIVTFSFGGLEITSMGLPIPNQTLFPGLLGMVASISVIVLYWIIMEWLLGATGGKLLLGVRVVSSDGRPCAFSQALKRNILRFVIDIHGAYLVGFLAILYDDRRRRIGDMVANTMVVTSAMATRLRNHGLSGSPDTTEPRN